MARSRGRPREFDESLALEAAADVFWSNGYSGTSLDDLAAAMGMNRPSIYRAFGDKQSLYRRALARFCETMELAMQNTLFSETDIHKGLGRFLREALSVYVSGEQPRGCMVMSTAVAAAVSYPEIRENLLGILRMIDQKIEERMRQAVEAGELPAEFDVRSRAAIAQGLLHTLSLRARAGESKARLANLIKRGTELVLS